MIENMTSIKLLSNLDALLNMLFVLTLIDSQVDHIMHVIKIEFINKWVDFIDLPSLFRDNIVESTIPEIFENKEPPIIC